MATDVVKGEGKGRQHGGSDSDRIETKSAASKNADDQRDSAESQCDGQHSLQRWLLQAARHCVEQNPHRCGVLQSDGSSDGSSLNREIVEIIGGCDSENSEQKHAPEIDYGQAQTPPSARCEKHNGQQEKRKRRAGLREDQWIDRPNDLASRQETTRECGAP